MHLRIPLLLSLAVLPAMPARAAESYDNCTGFITSLPATVTTQGVWCMDRDLATNITSGEAITLAANNITLDCNGYKLGGLAAGTATTAIGVFAAARNNITIRNCNVRGFATALYLQGPTQSGHVLEDNRLDGNTVFGMLLQGDGVIVRRNLVIDTGGSTLPLSLSSIGIQVNGTMDVQDNIVSGVSPAGDINASVSYGIRQSSGTASVFQRNTIRNLVPGPNFGAYGIHVFGGSNGVLVDNIILGSGAATLGITCGSVSNHIRGNTIRNAGVLWTECSDGGGNSE